MTTTANTILDVLRAAQQGSRKVRVTFNKGAISELVYLRGMINSNIISIDLSDWAVLLAVMESRDWEYDDNRTTTITLTPGYDDGGEDWFFGRMRRAIEKIELSR